MVETPYGPERRDRDDEPLPGSPSRAGFAGAAHGEPRSEDEDAWSGEGGDWDLPDWVDGLEEIDLGEDPAGATPGDLLGGSRPAREARAAFPEAGDGPLADALPAELFADPFAAPEADAQASEATPARSRRAPRRAPGVPAAEPSPDDEDWGIEGELGTGASWLMDLDESELGGDLGDGGEDELEPIAPLAPARASWRARIALVALAAITAAGGYQLYRTFAPGPEIPPAPARPLARPTPAPPTAPTAPETGPETELALTGGAPEVETPSEPGVAEPGARSLAGREPYLAFTDLGFALRPLGALPFLVAHFAEAPEPAEFLADAARGAEPQEVAAPTREMRETTLAPEDLVLLPEAKSPFRTASAEDLAMMWLGTTVPMDAIDEPERVLTPNVGAVRLVLYGGELFDGRLYAVGERKVWLEMNVGRLALLSHQIERIEHIQSSGSSPGLGEKGSQRYMGLEKVRVRTPGGVFYGSLLDRQGDVVTLLTAEGARITLHDARVEPAGLSRSRIVDASADAAAELPEPQLQKRILPPARR